MSQTNYLHHLLQKIINSATNISLARNYKSNGLRLMDATPLVKIARLLYKECVAIIYVMECLRTHLFIIADNDEI